LTIDGVNGGSVSKDHQGAFEISSFDFDISNLTSNVGSGSGAGKSTFSPLTIELDANSGLADLLRNAATGRFIRSIRLEGVTAGDSAQRVYDLKLGNVLISQYQDTNSGKDKLVFDYAQIELITTPQNSSGGLGTPTTFAYDLVTNQTGGTVPNPIAAIGNATGGSHPNLTYYLTIDGVNGGSVSRDHQGAFEISSFNFDISNLTGAVGSGSGTGKSTFSPLTINLDANSGLAELLRNAATGRFIRSIRLEGVTAGDSVQRVYDLKLGNVLISQYQDTNSGKDKLVWLNLGIRELSK
jgi:type VI protein secretion system component Hcp